MSTELASQPTFASSASKTKLPQWQTMTEAQKERKRAWTRARYQDLKEKKRKEALDYYHANKDRVLAQKKAKRDSIPGFNQKTYQRRKTEYRLSAIKWRKENPEKVRDIQRAYRSRRGYLAKLGRANNPERKMIENFRSRIYNLVKRNNPKNKDRSYAILGCTPSFFRGYLEAQFGYGMCWENYGTYWQVDHRIPLTSFNLSDPEKVKQAFHYTNCRPLTSFENNSKSNSLPGPHQPLLI